MGRIRSIKPEFPQSESIGRLSRDARLLFVQLWTIADDEGRGRGADKVLSSLLFPYDDDAPKLIGKWLTELEREGCVDRYQVEDSTYFQISKWTTHQKIDKPSPSRLPAPTGEMSKRVVERDIEDALFASISAAGELFGHKVLDIKRQVRVGSLYLDIFVTTPDINFVLEVKKGRLTDADVEQVTRYANLTGACPVLVGNGVSPQMKIEAAKSQGVALVGFSDVLSPLWLISPNDDVTECSITFESVPERHPLDLGSRTLDLGPRIEDLKPLAPSPTAVLAAVASPVFMQLPTNRQGVMWEVNEQQIAEWTLLFPAVDVHQEIRNIRGWLDSNRIKRKTLTGMPRMINRWLTNAQNERPRLIHGTQPSSASNSGNAGGAVGRVERSLDRWDAAAKKRGVFTAPPDAETDAGPLSPSGAGGYDDRGLPVRLREADGQVWSGQSGESVTGFAYSAEPEILSPPNGSSRTTGGNRVH